MNPKFFSSNFILPAYQLHQFNQKGYRKYICGSCTVDIPNDIKEHSFENEPNEELQVCIIEHTKVIDQNRSMGRKIDELEKRQELLRKVIKDQKQQLNSKIKTLRKEIQKLQIKYHLGTVKLHRAKKIFLISIENLLDKKLENIAEKIKKSVLNELTDNSKNIDQKLNEVIDGNKSYAKSVKVSHIDKESNLKGAKEFKSILNDVKNEQLLEEKERLIRSKNLIIFGVAETGDDADDVKNNDGIMIGKFFEAITVQAKPLNFYRLGKPETDKIRPLKLEMASSTERNFVMKNLKLLKGTEKELGKLSVKEDYTKNERVQIKKFVDTAKAKNAEENDPSHYWVVRGTPKNGISLVKLARR